MTLKELRKNKKLTQKECANFLGVPLRTYQNYETDLSKAATIKYTFMLNELERYGFIDEENGILTVEQIRNACGPVLEQYDVVYCYLFGSYAKEKATQTSDVDLLVATPVSGMRFYALVEELRQALKKKVDVLKYEQLNDNPELTNEILKDGIKVYG